MERDKEQLEAAAVLRVKSMGIWPSIPLSTNTHRRAIARVYRKL